MSELVRAALAVISELWAIYRATKAKGKAAQVQAKAERMRDKAERKERRAGASAYYCPPPPPPPPPPRIIIEGCRILTPDECRAWEAAQRKGGQDDNPVDMQPEVKEW